MTIVGWSPEDDKINTITAVEPAEDNKESKKDNKNTSKGKTKEAVEPAEDNKESKKDNKNTSKGKTKEAVEPAEIEPIIEE